jgi:RpiR family transcriptional regulator, carbohydrate utilization regulator
VFSGREQRDARPQYATFRFAAVGRAVEAPTDAVTAHLVAAGLASGDVCVAVGGSGANALTVRIAQAAAAAGATVVAITSYARGPLANVADLHLVVGVPASPPGERDHSRIRVSQMLVIDALQAAVHEYCGSDEFGETMYAVLNNYTYRSSGRGPVP